MTLSSFMLVVMFVLAALPADLRAAASSEWSWRELTPSAGVFPEPRRNGTAIYDPVGQRIVIFGGTGTGGLLNDLWAFDLKGRAWSRLEALGTVPEPRLGHNAVYDPIGHQMVLWAGQQGGRFFNDTWTLSLTTLRWTAVSPSTKPKARYGSVSVFDPAQRGLVQFAGFTEEGSRFQDSQIFSLDSLQWRDVTPGGIKPQVRCLHTAAFRPTSRRMIVYGGQRSGQLDDLWEFDLSSNTWSELTPASRPAGRFFASSFVDGEGRFLVFGGNTSAGNVNETWSYDFDSGSWSRLEIPGGPPERNGMMGAYIPDEDRFVIFGGTGARLYNDVWELRKDADFANGAQSHFAQFANGDSWISSFVLTNPSSSVTTSGAISFFDDRGQPLALALDAQAPATSIAFNIPPLGRVTFTTDGAGNLVSGWARITASSAVSGVIKFTAPTLGTTGVGASAPVRGFITPISRSTVRGISTGMAVAAAGAAVNLTLMLRDQNGTVVNGGQSSLTLAANSHLAQFVEQLFPDAATKEFEGTLTVTSEGGDVIATAIQLGSRSGEFTTLPVTSLR
jgi:hypothetical protein